MPHPLGETERKREQVINRAAERAADQAVDQIMERTHPHPHYEPQWDRLTRLMVTVFLIVAAIWIISLIGPVTQTLVIAGLFAFIMYLPARAIKRRSKKLPWAAIVAILYVIFILLVILILSGIIPSLGSGINNLIDVAQTAYNELVEWLRNYEPEQGIVNVFNIPVDFNPIVQSLEQFMIGIQDDGNPKDDFSGDPVPESANVIPTLDVRELFTRLFQYAGPLTGVVTGAISTVAAFITTLVLAVFVSFLIVIELPQTDESVSRWIPAMYHREAALILERINKIWVGFFRGQVIIGLVIGVFTFFQLQMMGVPSATALAIIVAIISLIPTIGGFIAIVPLGLVPLIQGSEVWPDMPNLTFALLVVGINVLMQQIIWNVVAPKILGDALNLPVVVIIVGVFIGAAVGGVLGAFLVAPIISTMWVLAVYAIHKISQQDPFPGELPRAQLGSGGR